MHVSSSDLAESVIGHLDDRWHHVQEVAATAARVCETLRGAGVAQSASDVVDSAWLHDIGYGVSDGTGFHPLDGARLLRRLDVPGLTVSLVAYHSSAEYEAVERGLLESLVTEFEPPDPMSLSILTYCDMHVGPTGEPLTFDARLSDITTRYGNEHLVARSMLKSAPEMRRRIEQVEEWLALASPSTADRA